MLPTKLTMQKLVWRRVEPNVKEFTWEKPADLPLLGDSLARKAFLGSKLIQIRKSFRIR